MDITGLNISEDMIASTAAPTVSVIIPAFNCEPYITETINSVLSQTFKDFELIVVDDGSTDRTPELVTAFGSIVRLISQDNARVCAARNRGIREARGRYICLMDHDDYWFPDKLELQVATLENHPDCGVVYSSFILWHADAEGCFPSPASFDLNGYPPGFDDNLSGWIYHQLLLDCWMLTSTAMFRREVFDLCGVFDEALPYSEDWDLWLRISRQYRFAKLNRPNTLYRQHHQQGNRIVRDVDYRTLLLKKTAKRWGYCSKDGRCISRLMFHKKLAEYHSEYALHRLQAGSLGAGFVSLVKAWVAYPVRLRYLAFILASILGWRPKR